MAVRVHGATGTPSWTYDQTTGKWTRQIAAFNGMAAVQESGGEPVLQLTDLEGSVVETAPLSSSATEPSTKERSTEFGVPTSSKPTQKYNWLGGSGLSATVSSTGTIAKDGSTYVPQLGQSLQTTSTAPPIPINKATPFVSTTVPWMAGAAASAATHETALYEEALQKAKEAQEAREAEENMPAPDEGGAQAPTYLGGSLRWECEYAVTTNQSIPAGCSMEIHGTVGHNRPGMAHVACWLCLGKLWKEFKKKAGKDLKEFEKIGKWIYRGAKRIGDEFIAYVQTERVRTKAECYRGGSEMYDALDHSLEPFPRVEFGMILLGCLAETRGGEVGNTYIKR